MVSRHPLIGLTDEEISNMLLEMGLKSIHELFEDVPPKLFMHGELGFSKPLTESEVKQAVKEILLKNEVLGEVKLFMGGGVWPHFIPSVVKEVLRRSELLTSYTPYQPETSQGILQALFEYQSLMAELLDVEVVNASIILSHASVYWVKSKTKDQLAVF